MTIDQMIHELTSLRTKVGGEKEVPVVIMNYGENDYIVPQFAVAGNFIDQDGNGFECALVGEYGGEEFTEKGIPHYVWKPKKDNVPATNVVCTKPDGPFQEYN